MQLNKFKEQSNLKTYFYSICKFTYLNKYKTPPSSTVSLDIPDIEENSNEYDNYKKALFNNLLKKLSNSSQEFFSLVSRGFDYEEITQIKQWKSEDTAKSTAYRCREKLRTLIFEHTSKK